MQGCINHPRIQTRRESSNLWQSPGHLFVVNCFEDSCKSPTELIEWTPWIVRASARKLMWIQEGQTNNGHHPHSKRASREMPRAECGLLKPGIGCDTSVCLNNTKMFRLISRWLFMQINILVWIFHYLHFRLGMMWQYLFCIWADKHGVRQIKLQLQDLNDQTVVGTKHFNQSENTLNRTNSFINLRKQTIKSWRRTI